MLKTVRLWLEKALGQEAQTLKHHFIGVSTKPEKMTAWGIAPENQFLLWDWVGGRYSLWSCIGLPIALTIGVNGFKQFLAVLMRLTSIFKMPLLSRIFLS